MCSPGMPLASLRYLLAAPYPYITYFQAINDGVLAAYATVTSECSPDGGVCSCTGDVVYGAAGVAYSSPVAVKEEVECSATAFGTDPAPGTTKHCLCTVHGDSGVASCSSDSFFGADSAEHCESTVVALNQMTTDHRSDDLIGCYRTYVGTTTATSTPSSSVSSTKTTSPGKSTSTLTSTPVTTPTSTVRVRLFVSFTTGVAKDALGPVHRLYRVYFSLCLPINLMRNG